MMYMITALLLGQVAILSTVLLCFFLLLRRMQFYHQEKMQQTVDVMVDHQKINQLVAAAVATEHAQKEEATRQALVDAAADIRKRVVDEAAVVRGQVEKAASAAQTDFAAGAEHLNTKLDSLAAKGPEETNKKLDTLLGQNVDETVNKKLDSLLVKSTEPIPVEVVNQPRVRVVKDTEPKG